MTAQSFDSMTFDSIVMREEQKRIAERVLLKNAFSAFTDIKTIAAADMSCGRFSHTGFAAVMLFTYPSLDPIDQADVKMEMTVPYVPGYLAFREGPLIHACLDQLKMKPDVILCDGHGIAHPRRAGIACHIGVEADIASIGCGKTRLVGAYEEPASEKGQRTELIHHNVPVGKVLRSRDNVKPLFISPGHKFDIETATEFVFTLCRGYRLPEPIRHAHRYVNQLRRADR